MTYTIRPIEPKDNAAVESVIRACLIEFGANHEGTAWADPDLGRFSEIYNTPGNRYWVAEDENGVLPEIEAAARDMEIFWVSDDILIQTKNAAFRLFAPLGAASDNDNCLTCLLTVGNFDTLITGDLSTAGELRLLYRQDLPDVELLVVGHHGAASSTGNQLLQAVTPEIAVISVGDNTYGHPAAQTLTRLESAGCQVYRTDLQGTIIFER